LVSLGDDNISISVSKKEIDRASRIVNASIRYFEKRGCEFCWWGIRPGVTKCGFEIGKEFVALKFEEPVRSEIKQRKQRSEYDRNYVYEVPYAVYRPTGKFTLSINEYVSGAPQQNWSDGKMQRVEMILGKFASAVMLVAEVKRIERQHEEARRAE
jgi:hypothetical protein